MSGPGAALKAGSAGSHNIRVTQRPDVSDHETLYQIVGGLIRIDMVFTADTPDPATPGLLLRSISRLVWRKLLAGSSTLGPVALFCR